jgi:hypothetical protein
MEENIKKTIYKIKAFIEYKIFRKKRITANEMKDRFIENIDKLSSNEENQYHFTIESIEESQKKFLEMRLDIENKYPLELIKCLSQWQFENWKFLIPNAIQDEWEAGLRSGAFYYKLCGAGDGGFFLKFYNT